MNSAHIEDLPSDPEDTIDPYDVATREGSQPERAPMEDYIGQQLSRFSNEAGHALAIPFGSPEAESVLRGFLERVRRGCRRMARKLNCMASHDEPFVGAASGSGVRSAGRQTSVTRSSGRTMSTRGGRRGGSLTIASPRASSATRVRSGSSSRGKQAAVDDSEDEGEDDNESNDSEDADPTYDIIGSSQLVDAPSPTQPTQGTPQKRRASRRDRTDVGSANVLPTAPGRPRRKKKTWTPNPTPGGEAE
ncbi:unnamed protein product [Urochloa humidicola]